MMTTMEEQLYGFYQIPGSKNHWEEKYSLTFLVSRNSLKRDIFVNFLPQIFITKYGIVSTYSATFVSQKILACLQCNSLLYSTHMLFFFCLVPDYITRLPYISLASLMMQINPIIS